MGWEQTVDGDERLVWERDDDYARVVVRQTATGAWAVTLDRLRQAPEGETYVRKTVEDRAAALDLAADWRREHDTE